MNHELLSKASTCVAFIACIALCALFSGLFTMLALEVADGGEACSELRAAIEEHHLQNELTIQSLKQLEKVLR